MKSEISTQKRIKMKGERAFAATSTSRCFYVPKNSTIFAEEKG
jgi:hypothetical protein